MNKNLTEFRDDKFLFWRQETDCGTHLQTFAFNKFKQVKLFKNLFLCSFETLVSFWQPALVIEALTEARWSEWFIKTKAFY